jgi:hypothetical protein
MTCVNLQERFGQRYRVGWEADGSTRAQWPREEWPWLMELRCHHGKVYPWGGDLLEAVTDGSNIGAQLRRLPFVLATRGHEETVIRFHVDHLPEVLAVLKPYRRRQLSEAEKERLRAMAAPYRFAPGHGVQVPATAPGDANDPLSGAKER